MTTEPTILLFCLFAFYAPKGKKAKKQMEITMKLKNMLFCLFASLAPMARAKQNSRFCFFGDTKSGIWGIQKP
jgi:hypothetical protein